MSDFVEVLLTCADRQEAEKIADVLLDKKLIACAKFLPIESKFRWEGKIETSNEILVLMESVANNFNQIEAEVAKLHSYDTFVLKMLPVQALSKAAQSWFTENAKS